MPPASFRYVSGAPKTFARSDLDQPGRANSARSAAHISPPATRFPFVILKAGTLDDPALYGAQQMAIHTADKQARGGGAIAPP